MTFTSKFNRALLRSGSAFSAIAMLGAGVGGIVLATAPAAAQDYTNITTTGRVQGTNGEAVANATVTVTSNEQGFARTVTTSADGTFRIAQLPPGSYTFAISAPGFEAFTDNAVELSPSRTANEFTLAAEGGSAAAGEDIVVVGRRQIQDFDRTTTGAVIDVAELQTRVPVARNLNSVIQLAPATTVGGAAQNSAFRGLSSIGGGSVAENVFYVNGLNITEFRQGLGAVDVPFDFYQTVEVKNGGYQAEFGRATGGVVNATTKSGSNDFHAGVLVTYEPNSLQEDQPNTVENDNDGDFAERVETTLQASGALIKDHLFFYGLYNFRDIKTGDGSAQVNPDPANPYANYETRKSNSPFYGGKVDLVITDDHRVEFTYFNTKGETRLTVNNYDPDTNELSRTQGQINLLTGGENYVARYTGRLTDWFTVSAAYGRNERRQDQTSDTPDRPYVLDTRSGFNVETGNIAASEIHNNDVRKFYRADADFYFDMAGAHHLRFGYDQEDLTSVASTVYNGGSSYTINLAGADDDYGFAAGTEYFGRRTFINGGTYQTQNRAFYIQDNWSLLDNRLNLQLGLRNDRFENRGATGQAFYIGKNQWGPRLGFTFDPDGAARTKIYGSFGRYFLPIFGNTNIRGAGREYDVTEYFELAGFAPDGTPIAGAPGAGIGDCLNGSVLTNCEVIRDGTVTPTESTVAKNLKPQSMDEYILGAERRLGGRWTVGANFTYRTLNRALEDVAIDAAVRKYCADQGIAGCNAIWRGFTQYVLVNPGEDATITLAAPINGETGLRTVDFTAEQLGYPKAKRKYKAATIQFEREYDGVWSLAGSYTWTSLKGNYEGAVKSDNGQVDAGATTDFDQPGFTIGSYGPLPNERKHSFKLYGSYTFADWLTVGANAVLQSPRKFGCIGRVPASVDPLAGLYGAAGNFCRLNDQGEVDPSQPLEVVNRGSAFKSDWYSQLNLSVGMRLPTDLFDGTFRIDVFNVLNSKAALDFEERGTTDAGQVLESYKSPLVYQAPRYFRFQLGVNF